MHMNFNLHKWYCFKYFTALPSPLFSSLSPPVLRTCRICKPGNSWTTEKLLMSHCLTSCLLKTSISSVFTVPSNTPPLSHVCSYILHILSYLLKLINSPRNNGPTWVPLDLGGEMVVGVRGAPFLCSLSQYLWVEVALFDIQPPTEVDDVAFIEELIKK